MIGLELTISDILLYVLGWLVKFSIPVSIPLVIGLLLLRLVLQERFIDRMICRLPAMLIIVGSIVTVMFVAMGSAVVFTFILNWFEPATPMFVVTVYLITTFMLIPPLLARPE